MKRFIGATSESEIGDVLLEVDYKLLYGGVKGKPGV
jgi:hypothetical protein